MTGQTHREVGSRVVLLITLVAMTATSAIVLTLGATFRTLAHEPGKAVTLLALALALQLFSVEVHGRGSMSVSTIGFLTAGFILGPGPAMVFAFLAALVQWARVRGLFYRGIFDAANWSVSAGAAAGVYVLLRATAHSGVVTFTAAAAAGIVFSAINNGLLCTAMSFHDERPFFEVWRERFHWARFHFLSYGPLAAASTIAYQNIGATGLLAFIVPPALMLLSVREYLARTRKSVEEIRGANDNLLVANVELAERNADLQALLDFTANLAARAHDSAQLVGYAEKTLGRMTRGQARLRIGVGSGGTPLVTGGNQVGSLSLLEGQQFDRRRWERLREAILPQLATAIESANLVEEIRKTHLATIAALSRSIEAKDYYTGGHTERVAEVAVALARRLGYAGPDLDAIEIGALLHDVGKIGIPERILHKEGLLDDEEWQVMKQHPVIADYILSGVDLPPIVREIARSSHERIDGAGYPDALAAEQIPLPARIVLVADALDALTSDRSYRPARPLPAAMDELRANSGTQFCPNVIAALEQLYREEPGLLVKTNVQELRVVRAG